MTINVHDLGDLVRCVGTYTDVAGTLVDPSTASFQIMEPNGTSTTYTGTGANLIRDSLGVFHVDWPTTQSGRHEYRFKGAGTGAGAGVGVFYVEGTPLE